MKSCWRFSFLVMVALLLDATAFGGSFSPAQLIATPLGFEPNVGQAWAGAKFLSHAAEGTIFLEEDAMNAVLTDGKTTTSLRMRFSGKNRRARITPEEATGGVANYYRTADRRSWLEGIPFYSRVRYGEVYPGIDLVFHGRTGRLEYDFVVAPRKAVSAIKLEFPDAESLALDTDGSLVVQISGKHVRLLAPEAFQGSSGSRTHVDVRYRLLGRNRVAFAVGQHDQNKTLVIDPVVEYTRIIGMRDYTTVDAIAADGAGNLILTGSTEAPDYPNTGSAVNVAAGGGAVYLTKLDSSGNTILYSTMLTAGRGLAVAVDNHGSAYVAGFATNPVFPTTSHSLGSCNPSNCAAGFAAKFNSNGTLVYSTLLASGSVTPKAIAVTDTGEAMLAGIADNTLQTINAFQPLIGVSTALGPTGTSNPFFAKLNSAGTGYEFASYFGTGGGASGIALDPGGNIYLAGLGWVPLINPLGSAAPSSTPPPYIFISELSPDGQALLASTYLGGVWSGYAGVVGLAAASDGSVFVAGNTDQSDFPFTLNASRLPQFPIATSTTSGFHMFAVGLKPGLKGVNFSTYLGLGTAHAVALDKADRFYVAGSFIESLPTKNAVVSDLTQGGFVLSLDNTGTVTMATHYGGNNEAQIPTAVVVDGNDNIYIAGVPEANPGAIVIDPVNVGTGEAYSRQSLLSTPTQATFAAKIAPGDQPQVSLGFQAPDLILRDAGSADLHISGITSGGKVVTTSCGSTIPAGTECIIYSSGAITINSDAQPALQSFSPMISPYGLPLFVQPQALYLPPLQENISSLPQSIKVWNVQPIAQTITSITAHGDVSQTNDCPGSLASGANCTITATLMGAGGTIYITLPNGSLILISAWSMGGGGNSPLSLSMGSADFGSMDVGKPSLVRTIGVTNASSSMVAPLATLSGSPEFSIVGSTCTGSLPRQTTCGIGVQYTPVGNELSTATLTVTGGGGSANVLLSAAGKILSAVTVDPLELSFYNSALGAPSYGQSVTLTNTSTTPISLTGIQFGLANYSETDTCQTAIPPSGTCVITASITPQNIGDRSTTMTVSFDKAQSQVIPVNAQAEFPITASPTTVDFGGVTPVGSDSNSMSVRLVNNVPASVSYVLSITGDFAVKNNCPNPITYHLGCPTTVVFHPQHPGPQEASLTLSFPGLTQQEIVTLKGDTSSPGITISPSALAFGSIEAELTSQLQQLTLANPQSFPVTIPAPTLSGAGASEFLVSDNCGTILPGASCRVAVAFAPTSAGGQNATLTFQNGGSPVTEIPVSLVGIGTGAPGFSFQGASPSFGYVDVGLSSTTTQTITVANRGPLAAPLPILTMSGANSSEFAVTSGSSCTMVAANGGTCTLTVVFSPHGAGSRSAVLSFDSGATIPSTITLPLIGWGGDFALTMSPAYNSTISPGQSASFTLLVHPDGPHTGTASISCSASGASYGPCTMSPSIVDLGGGGGYVTITIAKSKSAKIQKDKTSSAWMITLCFLLAPCGIVLVRSPERRHVAIIALALSLISTVSCGGGGGNPSPIPSPKQQTYTYLVTVTGSSNNASHSATLTLVVNPQ